MRHALPALMVIGGWVGCAGVESAPPAWDVANHDAQDQVTTDAPEDSPTDAEAIAEPTADKPWPDTPATCLGGLSTGQCIAGAGCPPWMECIGIGGCEEPPCFGLCEEFPGLCLATTMPKPCDTDLVCGAEAICVGRILDAKGQVVLSGLCRKRPSDVACFEDVHCSDGQQCAGEVSCDLLRVCLGPPYPGRCVHPPPPGHCWDDGDCPQGERCVGTSWCSFGDASCQDAPGTCKEHGGCFSDSDCAGSADGGFCVGAFRCREGAQCVVPDTPGFCAPAPGLRRCWQPDHCGGDWVCRAALPCPAGSLCEAVGARLAGICGEAPAPGEGLVVALSTNQVLIGKPFRVVVLNRGAVPVFLDPCFLAVVQFEDDSSKWTESWIAPARHPACDLDIPLPLWFLPPGSGVAVEFTITVPQTKYRILVPYQVGCEQGVVRTQARCAADALAATTMAFEVL